MKENHNYHIEKWVLPLKTVRKRYCHVAGLNTSYAQITSEPALILTPGPQGRLLCLSDGQGVLKLAGTWEKSIKGKWLISRKNKHTSNEYFWHILHHFETLKSQSEADKKRYSRSPGYVATMDSHVCFNFYLASISIDLKNSDMKLGHC